MKLKIKCLNQYAREIYKEDNESRMERGDSGYDLYNMKNIIVPPHSTVKIGLGIACSPDIHSGYYLYPRSSISKTSFRLANSVGIIDVGYRGEICAMIDNISGFDQEIKQGDRLFQLCSPDLTTLYISIVDELDETQRGTSGFGSTGF